MPGGPTKWTVLPPPTSANASNKKGQPKQWSAWKCDTTTTSTSSTAKPHRRRCGRAVGEGSTSTFTSRTKLFQYRPGGARKLPVPRKVSVDIRLGRRSAGVGQGQQRRHQDRVAHNGVVGHRQAAVEHEDQIRSR